MKDYRIEIVEKCIEKYNGTDVGAYMPWMQFRTIFAKAILKALDKGAKNEQQS